MPRLTVSVSIDAPPEEVWADVSDLSSHVEWMHDARSITFVTDEESGVGATFDCETRIGPFRLNDRMEVTSWVPGRELGVRHVGLVTGTGVFTLHPERRRRAGRDGLEGPDPDGKLGKPGKRGKRSLRRRRTVGTRFVWRERLRFPWWLGGPLGAFVARPVLRRVWRRNLRNLAARFA